MSSIAQLRFSPFSNTPNSNFAGNRHFSEQSPLIRRFQSHNPISLIASSPTPQNLSFSLFQPRDLNQKFTIKADLVDTGGYGGNGGSNDGGSGGKGGDGNSGRGDGGGNGDSEDRSSSSSSSSDGLGILGLFLNGWRSRVSADPQFPFKVLMEEIVGVSACVLGDMASRPNFGLNELDFVFSTLVVGSIMNFVLMYLLAPTMGSSSSTLPAIFSSCPKSHMFEPGMYSIMDRCGTFIYKGIGFAVVGFAAGLVGTAISNGLILMRKKMDPNFETPNKPPPTILNALTWATHMGLSSNFRYQTLNGIEYLLAKGLPPLPFKASVVILRCLNNVLGGVSFVTLARLTGSQKVDEDKPLITQETRLVDEKEKLIETHEDYQSNDPTSFK